METQTAYRVEATSPETDMLTLVRRDAETLGEVLNLSGHITELPDGSYLFDGVEVAVRPESLNKTLRFTVAYDRNTKKPVYTSSTGETLDLSHRPYEENLEKSQAGEITEKVFSAFEKQFDDKITESLEDPTERNYQMEFVTALAIIMMPLIFGSFLASVLVSTSFLVLEAFLATVFITLLILSGSDSDTTKVIVQGLSKNKSKVREADVDLKDFDKSANRVDRFYSAFETESERSQFFAQLLQKAEDAGVEFSGGIKVTRERALFTKPLVEFTGVIGDSRNTVYYDGVRLYRVPFSDHVIAL